MNGFRHLPWGACVCALLALGGCNNNTQEPQVNANQAPPTTDPNERARIEKGLQITPVPVDLTNRDRDLVGLGSYIVNAQGGCNDCHTNPSYAPGGNPFQGQPTQVNASGFLKGGIALGGLPAPNLRPDANGNPFGLTQDAFIQVIRSGNAAGHILQVMPWPVFQNMTDRDLSAIYAYLSALPQQ